MLVGGPLAWCERRFGKRATNVACYAAAAAGAALQVVGAAELAPAAVVVGGGMQGFSYAAGQSCRFNAAALAPAADKAKAVSWTVLGGAAAVLGPEVARMTLNAVPGAPYVGSFITAGVIQLAGLVCSGLVVYDDDGAKAGPAEAGGSGAAAEGGGGDSGAPGTDAPKDGDAAVAGSLATFGIVGAVVATSSVFCVMAAMMQTTPLAMLDAGFDKSMTVWVTEGHILGMFLPSLVSGRFVRWVGAQNAVVLGWCVLCVGGALPVVDAQRPAWAYFAGLVLIGVGWNLAYVGASLMLASTTLPPARAATLKRLTDGLAVTLVGCCILSTGAIFGALRHDAWWLYVGVGGCFLCLAVCHRLADTPDIPRVVAVGTRGGAGKGAAAKGATTAVEPASSATVQMTSVPPAADAKETYD
uniref:Major facilitator superfamily (MFS) profile domain-containing protein n=1 Tax=Bicosoecida sp. CB-2014 TaxID=1486930 RepID=A0A7S1G3L3_9STRA